MQINEIFYSLQGEGAYVGAPAIFVRLAGCNLRCPFCDTDYTRKETMDERELLAALETLGGNCCRLIWTGGEPGLQLTEEIVAAVAGAQYFQAIETNGTLGLPENLDWITVSPKPYGKLYPATLARADEVKIVLAAGEYPEDYNIPPGVLRFVSPKWGDADIPWENVRWCIDFVKENPEWRLTWQVHKIWQVQ